MLRRKRTREPTCTSIGFGLSPLWRPGRRICWCIAIFGRLPSQKQQVEPLEYTIIRDQQPGYTENKQFLRYANFGAGRSLGLYSILQRNLNAIGRAPSRRRETRAQSPTRA